MRPLHPPRGRGTGSAELAVTEGDLPRLMVGRFLGDGGGDEHADEPSPHVTAAAAAAERHRRSMADMAGLLFREEQDRSEAGLIDDPRPPDTADSGPPPPRTSGAFGRSPVGAGRRGKPWLPPAELLLGSEQIVAAGGAAGTAALFVQPSPWGSKLGQRRRKVWALDTDRNAEKGRWRIRPQMVRPPGRAEARRAENVTTAAPPPSAAVVEEKMEMAEPSGQLRVYGFEFCSDVSDVILIAQSLRRKISIDSRAPYHQPLPLIIGRVL